MLHTDASWKKSYKNKDMKRQNGWTWMNNIRAVATAIPAIFSHAIIFTFWRIARRPAFTNGDPLLRTSLRAQKRVSVIFGALTRNQNHMKKDEIYVWK